MVVQRLPTITTLEQGYRDMQVHVAHMTDRLGKRVDEGIAETVVFLNLLQIPTSGSCEGHLTHGTGAPWVDIEQTGLAEEAEEAQKLFRDACERKQALGEMTTEVLRLFEEAHLAKRGLKKKHLAIRQKLLGLLEAFYEQRYVPLDQRLVIQSYSAGRSRLESQGADMQEVVEEEVRQVKLLAYQQEMQAFTALLAREYFAQAEAMTRAM